MVQIRSVSRLIAAVASIRDPQKVVPQQISRIQERLSSGVDFQGHPFAPYKTDRPQNHDRPLQYAAELFDDARIEAKVGGHDVQFFAKIYGQAAKIARYQNVRRKFLPFSDRDHREFRSSLLGMLKDGWRASK